MQQLIAQLSIFAVVCTFSYALRIVEEPRQLMKSAVKLHSFLKRNTHVSVLTFATDVKRAPLEDFYLKQLGQTHSTGQGSHFEGWAMKWKQLRGLLSGFEDQNHFVIVTDYDDVIFNGRMFADREQEAESILKRLTANAPQAIVIGAESQCCVGALQYLTLDSWFKRNETIFKEPEHPPVDEFYNSEWAAAMRAAAPESRKNLIPFLNAGLVAGRVSALLKAIDVMNLHKDDDDQAVLTAMYLNMPGQIVLDFNAELFGNVPHTWAVIQLKDPKSVGCAFTWNPDKELYKYSVVSSFPLFIHTPGQFGYEGESKYKCLKQFSLKLALRSSIT